VLIIWTAGIWIEDRFECQDAVALQAKGSRGHALDKGLGQFRIRHRLFEGADHDAIALASCLACLLLFRRR